MTTEAKMAANLEAGNVKSNRASSENINRKRNRF